MDVYNVQSIKVFAGVPLPSSSRASRASPLAPKIPFRLTFSNAFWRKLENWIVLLPYIVKNLVVFTDEIHEKKIKQKNKNKNKNKQQQQSG